MMKTLLFIFLFIPLLAQSQVATIQLADGTFINNAPSGKDWSNYKVIGFSLGYTEYQVIIDENNPVIVDGITILASGYQNQPPDNVYPPIQIFDGDLTTKWAAKGFGHWVQFSLPDVQTLQSIDIAFHVGDRNDVFDLLISKDSISWATVLDKQVGELGTGFNNYDFTDVEAKHIRYVAQGNIQSNYDWNSISEVKFNYIDNIEIPCDSIAINWIDSTRWTEKDTLIVHHIYDTIPVHDSIKIYLQPKIFIKADSIIYELE